MNQKQKNQQKGSIINNKEKEVKQKGSGIELGWCHPTDLIFPMRWHIHILFSEMEACRINQSHFRYITKTGLPLFRDT